MMCTGRRRPHVSHETLPRKSKKLNLIARITPIEGANTSQKADAPMNLRTSSRSTRASLLLIAVVASAMRLTSVRPVLDQVIDHEDEHDRVHHGEPRRNHTVTLLDPGKFVPVRVGRGVMLGLVAHRSPRAAPDRFFL